MKKRGYNMRKCNAILIINDTDYKPFLTIENLTVINSGNVNIPLIRDNKKPYKYNKLSDLLYDVKMILKNNGFELRTYDHSFNTQWLTCDIIFKSNLTEIFRFSKNQFIKRGIEKMLSKKDLQILRNEVVLNSLFTSDYENSFDLDTREVNVFFDGYLDYLEDLMLENDCTDENYFNNLRKYDTLENLWTYYNELEEVNF